MNNKKTVTEWLEQAKADGYPWAQSAMDQMTECNEDYYASSLSHAVLSVFNWAESKVGLHYWSNIHDELLEKERQTNEHTKNMKHD